MSQLQVTGEAKIRDIQGPVIANSGVITALDGAASQYVRGDGTLADFPTSTGGGSSVSYYLNSSVSQGTIGGVAYRELSKEPIIGAGTDITISANGYVASYITDANDPDVLSVPGGNFNCEFYFSVNNNTGNPTTYAELYKYDGTTFTLLGSSQAVPESINQGTTIAPYYFAIPVATAALALTDRLAIRIYVSVDGRTVTLHTENSHLCQVVTTFSKGMVSLNNLTDQSQYLTTGTSGTNFAIVSSGDTHTFNLPVASATNTGKLSSTDWSTFNAKQPAGNYVTLDTTQTITAEKTFTQNLSLDGNGSNAGTLLLKNNTISPVAIGYASINSNGNNINLTAFVSATKTASFDLSGISDNIPRTFTFPNASGTLALTSNLSAYVPYTGATGNVDLGLFGLTSNAVKAIGDNSTYGGVISIKQNNVIGGLIGTGYTELFGKTNRLGISFGAGSIAYLSNSVLTAERTYTLPDATGTIALTSNLSSYVPYTGATSAVNLGTNNLIAKNTLADGLLINQSGSGSVVAGYTTIRHQTGSGIFGFLIDNSNTGVSAQLLFNNATSYEYTFPNASGTLALLEGTQTFTGVKSFDTGILLKNGVVTTTSGYTGIGAGTSGINVSLGSGGGGLLIFQSTSYNYTFPAATGTIALTSNLSSYVPYTGATANVDLGIRALFAQNIVVGQTSTQGYIHFKTGGSTALSADTSQAPYGTNGMIYSFDQTGGNYKQFVIDSSSLTNNTIRTYTMPNASGTLALTSDLGAYLPLTGGTLTGALNGTSATFSTDLVVNGWLRPNSIYAFTADAGTTYIQQPSGGNIVLRKSDSTAFLTIANTGAATFSSSVVSNSYFQTSGNGTYLRASNYTWMGGSGGDYGSVGYNQGYTTNTTTYNYVLSDFASILRFDSGGFNFLTAPSGTAGNAITFSPAMRILNNGNVGIGTSSPANVLHVVGGNGNQMDVDNTGQRYTQLNFKNNGTQRAFLAIDQTASEFQIYGQAGFALALGAGGGERMRITSGGNVGIGTSSPSAQLDVSTTARFHSSSNWMQFQQNVLTSQNTDGAHIRSVVSADSAPTYSWAGDTDTGMYTPAANTIAFSTGATERLRITSGGNVLIGKSTTGVDTNGFRFDSNGVLFTSVPTGESTYYLRDTTNAVYRFYVTSGGTINATNTTISAISDVRLKENITDLQIGLDAIMALRPRQFDWKKESGNSGKNVRGFIAQEFEQVFPDLIDESINKTPEGEPYKQIRQDLIPILVKAIQELNERIKQLENK